MPTDQTALTLRHEGTVTIIGFQPNQRVFSRPSVEQMSREFNQAIEKSKDLKFVVSFEGVEYMSSTVLGTLVAGLMKIHKRGGELRIACVTEDLALLFQLTGLHKVFEICGDVDAALKSMAKAAKKK